MKRDHDVGPTPIGITALFIIGLVVLLAYCAGCCAKQGHHQLETRNNMLRQQVANQEMTIYNQSVLLDELVKQIIKYQQKWGDMRNRARFFDALHHAEQEERRQQPHQHGGVDLQAYEGVR